MRIFKSLAIYKHFKGNYYATLGLSMPKSKEEFKSIMYSMEYEGMTAKDTETNKPVTVLKVGNYYIHNKDKYGDITFALYKSLYDDTGVYARKVDMFMSEIEPKRQQEYNQKYRFEEVCSACTEECKEVHVDTVKVAYEVSYSIKGSSRYDVLILNMPKGLDDEDIRIMLAQEISRKYKKKLEYINISFFTKIKIDNLAVKDLTIGDLKCLLR